MSIGIIINFEIWIEFIFVIYSMNYYPLIIYALLLREM